VTRPAAPTVRLRKAVERTIHEGHPWLFSHAADTPRGEPGTEITVLDRKGRFLARGLSDQGRIAIRVFTLRDEPIDSEMFARRLRRAAELRARVVPAATTAYRLVHGEGDRLPGLVVDVYGSYAVLQLDGAVLDPWRRIIAHELAPVLRQRGVQTLIERTGARGNRQAHAHFGPLPQGLVTVHEHGMAMPVDLQRGQKTGLFLDHRESRRRLRDLSGGQRVLNLYGYTGGFSVAAGLGGATRVTTVDVAPKAIALAERSWSENGLEADRHEGVTADVEQFLARKRKALDYDIIVSDPPSFAPNEDTVDGALGAYRALHASALARIPNGGLYLAASCSSHVDRASFEQTVRDGARKARRIVQVLERWGAPADHPRLLAFPEGDYLKVLLTRLVA
jgi:23S rRNA (cytosine1962-C5)-methyltransferase